MRKEIMKLWYDAPDANSGFDAILEFIEAHTQSKLKAFAGEVAEAIGEDEPLLLLGGTRQQDKANMGLNNLISQRNQVKTEFRESLKAIKKKAGIESNTQGENNGS